MRNIWEFGAEHTINGAAMVTGVIGNGLQFVSGLEWLNLNTSESVNQSVCLTSIDQCVHGFTLSAYVIINSENDTDQLLLTTGGHDSSGLGIAFSYTAMNKSMPFRRYFEVNVLTSSTTYRTWFNMQFSIWNLVTISYHELFGIKVFVDGKLSNLVDSGSVRVAPPVHTLQSFMVGDSNISTDGGKGRFSISNLEVVDRAVFGDTFIDNSELTETLCDL